jgi:putative membrane protein
LGCSGGFELTRERRAFVAIGVVSTAVLGFLFWLLYFRSHTAGAPAWTSSLPGLNAALNFSSSVLLIAGFVAIRSGRRDRHKKLMLAAVAVAGTFLVSYVVYHHFHGDTRFQGQGLIRPIYFFILISHITMSMVALPMVLTTLFFAASGRFERHKKLARYTFPVWLYVSITGVAVYFALKFWG